MNRPAPAIAINGKFLSAKPTAVHRVARELLSALAQISAPDRLRLLVPPGPLWPENDPGIAPEPAGHLHGIAWEQISLPRAARGDLLLNLCNTTPLLRRNALTMIHDAQVITTPQSFGRGRAAWCRLHARAAGRLQPGLLTVSEFARADLGAQGIAPAERIHVIPNGVDHVLRIAPETGLLERLNLVPRGFALALSNLQPHKNIALLLRAFSRPALAGLILALVGRAGRADFVAAGHMVPENVVFAGYVSDGGMRALQENALAVLTPSLTEGFGLPPVEGLFLGTPAIIAPCGALPEVCGPGALQADPQDPKAWEAAILRLQNEPDLRQSLAVSGQAFAARYTWEAAAKRLAGVIAGLSAHGQSETVQGEG